MYAREAELASTVIRALENRVKKLESEVDLLKNIIFTHISPPIPNGTVDQVTSNVQKPFQHRLVANRNSVATTDMGSNNTLDVRNKSPIKHQPCAVSNNPFQMRSFVHPTTAVPPGNSRPLFADLKNNNVGEFIINRTRGTSSSKEKPLPISRWSAFPSDKAYGENLSRTVDDSDQSENNIDINLPYKRHARQSFVEAETASDQATCAKALPCEENEQIDGTQTDKQSNNNNALFNCPLIPMIEPPAKPNICDNAPFVYITFNHPSSKEPFTKHLESSNVTSRDHLVFNTPYKELSSESENLEDYTMPFRLRQLLEKSPF